MPTSETFVKVLQVQDIYFLSEQTESVAKLAHMWNEIRDYFGKESLIDVTTYSTTFESLRLARITYNPQKATPPTLRASPTTFFTDQFETAQAEKFKEIVPQVKTVQVLQRFTSRF